MRLDSLETYRRERRKAALHEAAHAVLIERWGGIAEASIWENLSEDVAQKSWLGTCHVTGAPGVIEPNSLCPRIHRPPDDWRVLVGLAGVVAEIYSGTMHADTTVTEMQAFLDVEELSASDAELAGCEVASHHIERTVGFVEAWWTDIQLEADLLEQYPSTVPLS
jgi:hypothetical protein